MSRDFENADVDREDYFEESLQKSAEGFRDRLYKQCLIVLEVPESKQKERFIEFAVGELCDLWDFCKNMQTHCNNSARKSLV